MFRVKIYFPILVALLLLATVAAQCGAPATVVVTEIVEKEVVVTKEVVVEKEVIKEVEKEVIVTATPEPAKEPVEVTFYLFGPTPERRAAIDAALAIWHAQHPDIQIEIIFEGWMDGRAKALKEVAAGNPRNGVLNFGSWTGEFAKMGVLEPVDDYVAAWEDKDRIPDSFWEAVSLDGHIYGMPHYSTATVMHWNKDHFVEAGLDPEKPPTTYHELLEYAKKLTVDADGDGVIDRWGVTVAPGGQIIQQFEWVVFSFCKDAYFFKLDADGNHVVGFVDEDGKPLPCMVEGAQFFADLYNVHKVLPPDVLTGEWYGARTAFASGRASMVLDFALNTPTYQVQPELNFGVTLLPEGPGRLYTWMSPYDTVFFKGAQHMDEAIEFVKFLGVGQGAKVNTTIAGFLPLDQELMAERAAEGDEAFAVFAESLAKSTPQCFAPECGSMYETWPPIIQAMMLGEITAEEGMQQMADLIQADIDAMYTE
jgi:ABC-type glycerol-3-phosphate transport system substrate-binding protein